MIDTDTFEIRGLLGIPDWAPRFAGIVDRDGKAFRDHPVCDHCTKHGAVYVEYVVDSEGEWVSTDAMLCGDHASDEVRGILDNPGRSVDHDTDITVNYWAIQYGAFANTSVEAVAA
ncbi:hypothetical protein ACWIGI_28680 [Nocardia sp. NPDC055321]